MPQRENTYTVRSSQRCHKPIGKTNPWSTFVETNLAQMLAYTIYRGVQGGWLDAAYQTHADRMRQAAHAKVDPYGLVQGVCGAPSFDRSGTAPEGQAFFVLMEAAYRDLGA